jgi:mono/diheme cytochrome c family protein
MRSALKLRPALLIALPALLAAQEPAKPARTVDELKAFYVQNCVRCHGPDGSARDAMGKKLGGRDFTNPKDNREPDAAMAKTIRKGIFFGKVMPSFKEQLSEEEALTIIKEIVRKAEKGKLIAPAAEAPKPAAEAPKPPAEAPKTAPRP